MENRFAIADSEKSFIDLKNYDKNKCFDNDLIEVQNFKDFILQENYPCIGATTSVNSRNICIGVFDEMFSDKTIENLYWGVNKYIETLSKRKSMYLTYIAIFPQNEFNDEIQFENGLWKLLSKLHNIDKNYFEWDSKVSNNPESTEFSYSLGGESFFLVGMHPKSSRKARRFHVPAIAFNLHSQFEHLRSKGRYEITKNAVRANEILFQGSINPMLADHGEGLEAKQYSGRLVENSWECPFKHLI
ncbi:guanitoxin biosynthesis heme-dependent pre-guanitoxin N-hydroxylase GntA [Aurantibacter sp.]|uniref:guanitoxin biosynthesis heme-dependent pre-guanitoxin N-hydroxylase GntA n=1 Tax=Aurantibacter sp. TaxID=2807103 RepID=UPI0032658993